MTHFKRPLATLGASALLALSLTACGGGAPTDASEKDFCKDMTEIFTQTATAGEEDPDEKQWEAIQKATEGLEETGTPKSISDDERKGFEVFVDAVTGTDYDEAKDAFGEDDGETLPGVSKDDAKKADKFVEYAIKTCSLG